MIHKKSGLELDMFGYGVSSVELAREEALVNSRKLQQLERLNNLTVSLGMQAVDNGITAESLPDTYWATVARHRDLMRRTGSIRFGPELEKNRYDFYAAGKLVKIAGDIGVVLSQRSSRQSEVIKFWDMYEEVGGSSALAAVASPMSTAIDLYDLTQSKLVESLYLSPRSSCPHNDEFRNEWGSSLLPRLGIEFVIQSDEEALNLDDFPTRLTHKELVVAAGYNARFNGMLDEVERCI